MALESLSGGLDPLLWAKKPRSQTAINLLSDGAKAGDKRLADILAGHVRDGVCDANGTLLRVWSNGQWVAPPGNMRANHERRREVSECPA